MLYGIQTFQLPFRRHESSGQINYNRNMDLQLNGKTAVVAASSKGLGYATAKILAEEGANVVISGRNAESLSAAEQSLRTITENVLAVQCDVTDEAQVQTMIDQTVARFGGIDIVVTNAGGPPAGSFATTPLDAYQKAFDLTLMSTITLIHTALPHLLNSSAPSILTITSVSVKEPITNLLLSNVIRPGVIGLTKSLANELGRDGVRVNSILPGYTRTERMVYLTQKQAEKSGMTPEEVVQVRAQSVPMKRMGEPEEFGKVAAFLVSPAASYVTGTMVLVDGGRYAGLM